MLPDPDYAYSRYTTRWQRSLSLSYKLNATEQQNSGLLINCSARSCVKSPPGTIRWKEQRIQETVLRGVWRVREYNADQQRAADEIRPDPGEHLADASAAADMPELPPQPA